MPTEYSALDLLLGNCPEFNESQAKIKAEAARFNPTNERPACYPVDGEKCTRCKGRGVLDAFRHVSNGTCFRCGGWGVERAD